MDAAAQEPCLPELITAVMREVILLSIVLPDSSAIGSGFKAETKGEKKWNEMN